MHCAGEESARAKAASELVGMGEMDSFRTINHVGVSKKKYICLHSCVLSDLCNVYVSAGSPLTLVAALATVHESADAQTHNCVCRLETNLQVPLRDVAQTG